MDKILACQRSKTHDIWITIMREKQIWSKFGIDMEARYIPSGEMDHDSVDQHMKEGTLNLVFGYHHIPYVARAKKGSVKYTSVASISNKCPDVICVKPSIKGLKDLRGKRIAVQGYHPRSTVWRLLNLEGISVEDGEVEFMKRPASGAVYEGMLDQLKNGEADAAFLQPPYDKRAQEAGYVALEETRFFPNIMGATLTMTACSPYMSKAISLYSLPLKRDLDCLSWRAFGMASLAFAIITGQWQRWRKGVAASVLTPLILRHFQMR